MYSILLIEDDVALNKAISVYFKKENFQVDSFFCGHDMIDALEKNNFILSSLSSLCMISNRLSLHSVYLKR